MTEIISFPLPESLLAKRPPERRGIRRDRVRMMVSDRNNGSTIHATFWELPAFLEPGDVLVLNDSRTVPARFSAALVRMGEVLFPVCEIRLSRRLAEDVWQAIVPKRTVLSGDRFRFSPQLEAVVERVEDPLARLRFSRSGTELMEQLYRLGDPVRYEYVEKPWELFYYQTVFARHPGSVEMPSAGRPFSWEMLLRLKQAGVHVAYLTLHAGLSDFEDGGAASPADFCEPMHIPAVTAEKIRQAKREGKRVIAVGTTVVRALESAAKEYGCLVSSEGWACEKITGDTQLQIVDGLLTGFHEPEASHLELLCAFVSPEKLKIMYKEAIRHGYLWHEFGDVHLLI